MKILTLGRLANLGLIAGGIYYVRKHGGFRVVWNKLVAQLEITGDKVAETITTSPGPMRPIYGAKPTYTAG